MTKVPELNSSLAGRRALVCGSSQGIGLASAQELAARGAGVTLVARNEKALQAALGTLSADHEQEHGYLIADFNDPESLRTAVAEGLGGPCEILVNNTGGPPAGPILNADPKEFETALRLHVIANHLLVQTLLPGMKERGYGRIINIISTSVREPIPGLGVSNTTRGAVASWAKTLSRELGPFGITVNNVLPGFTDTGRLASLISNRAQRESSSEDAVKKEMESRIPLGRFASPAEIAAAVGFLASPAASYVTGVSLPVDGGRLASL